MNKELLIWQSQFYSCDRIFKVTSKLYVVVLYFSRITKNKISSESFFNKNNQKFDIVFVDGSHHADDVAKDCMSSWSVLKKNGILILDDFFWKGYDDLKNNPAYAINQFLIKIKNKYKLINLTKFQLFLEKVN